MVQSRLMSNSAKDPATEPDIMAAWRLGLATDGVEREIPPWMLSWAALGNLKIGLTEADVGRYAGPADLKTYFEAIRKYSLVRFFDGAARSIDPGFEKYRRILVDHCIGFNRRILAHYGFSGPELEKDFETHAHYTVEDYVFQ